MQQALVVLLLSISLIRYAPTIYRTIVNNLRLRSIPTVGCSSLLTSYVGAYRFWKHSRSIVEAGYHQFRGSVFKVPAMRRWVVVVSGLDKVDDIRRASDDYLSFSEAANEALDFDVTVGPGAFEDPAHVDVVRSPLTRNIGIKFSDVRDEIVVAFNDHIPIKDEWVKIRVIPTLMNIICRASNRMLVGLPLCRNLDYIDLCKRFAVDTVDAARTLKRLPFLIKPIAARFTKVSRSIERGMKHLEPIIKERYEQEALYGADWPERPNDMFTWLFQVSKGRQRSLREITIRVLLINLASIHTTNRTLTAVLFDLATYPEYVQPLREEIEQIVQREGWTKDAMGKMIKLDSFVKESMRLAYLSVFGIIRKVVKDFTFSDGTTVPAGNTLAVAIACMHTDSDLYTDPNTFDGFRFEKMRQEEGEYTKHRFVSIESDYLLFGQGRHACPGRFFVANELKALLAHILMNYDFKFANEGKRPEPVWYGESATHDPTAELLFRKRV